MKYDDTVEFGLPNCGVVAISLATGIQYNRVKAYISSLKIHPKKWKGRMYANEIIKALDNFNINYEEYGYDTQINPLIDNIRVREFAKLTENMKSSFIVCGSGHYIAIKGGVIGDQYSIIKYDAHKERKSRNYRVKQYWQISN